MALTHATPVASRSCRHSIVTRVLLIVALLAALLSAVPPAMTALQFREASRTIRQRHEAMAAKLAQEISGVVLFSAFDMLTQSFQYQAAASDMVFARMIERATRYVEATSEPVSGNVIDDARLAAALQQLRRSLHAAHYVRYGDRYDGQPVDTYVLPIFVRGVLTPYALQAGFALTQVQAVRRELLRRIAFSVVFCAGVTLALLWVLRCSVTRPILRLVQDVIAIGARQRNAVDLVGNNDELTVLACSFNAMLDELRAKQAVERHVLLLEQEVSDRKTYLSQLRYFSFWIAHDLEKHLLTLPAMADMSGAALAWTGLHRHLGDTCDRLKMVSRETETINASLAHAELFDFVPVAADTVDQFRSQHADVHLSFIAHAARVLIKGDSYLLHACINNLLDNAVDAIAAAGRPGHITVTLSSSALRASLSVADNGCGMDLDHTDLRQRIFMPFFSTKARAQGAGSMHHGLGLHFVNEVIVSHGGIVNVTSTPAVGTTFELSLPVPPSPAAP